MPTRKNRTPREVAALWGFFCAYLPLRFPSSHLQMQWLITLAETETRIRVRNSNADTSFLLPDWRRAAVGL